MNYPSNHRKKILIVDDDPRNIFALESALKLEGFNICSVSDGLQAVNAVRNDPAIYMVLMDIMMPLMDGYEAARQIRLMRDRSTIIIGLTAYAMRGARERCLEAGFSNYFAKPVDLGELITVLHASYSID